MRTSTLRLTQTCDFGGDTPELRAPRDAGVAQVDRQGRQAEELRL